jgi:hypothetical protein
MPRATFACTALACAAMSCSAQVRQFPLREPLAIDTDLRPVSVACHPDGDKQTCAPAEYVSPFVWDQMDNLVFAPVSGALSIDVTGESRNANSLDEVPDSSWFTNRPRHATLDADADAPGACGEDDLLPSSDHVPDHRWVIDHGKDNGSTLGFRVTVPEKGIYMLKADDEGKPERASAASVIGAAVYHAIGFNTSCEQIVVLRKAQLELKAGLKVVDNSGVTHPFDDAALDRVLATTTQVAGGRVRMQASKWLPGLPIGPFRYIGTRADDPNDVIDHADRRELRGSRVLAAWLDHWDAREQNSMDVWMASDPDDKHASPGVVMHYVLDTSDTLGGEVSVAEMSRRLGYSYDFDPGDIATSLLTLGAVERPWDRARRMPGREKFGYYRADDFEPASWKPVYPNPAFRRMTERDAAWMARLIARFSYADIRRLVGLGQWADPSDADYVTGILIERQHKILARYLTRLSPLGEIRRTGDQICATDFARLRAVAPADRFRYTVTERAADGSAIDLPVTAGDDGEVCFRPRAMIAGDPPADDPARRVRLEVRNGASAGPLVIHGFDHGTRGVRVVGATRPEP